MAAIAAAALLMVRQHALTRQPISVTRQMPAHDSCTSPAGGARQREASEAVQLVAEDRDRVRRNHEEQRWLPSGQHYVHTNTQHCSHFFYSIVQPVAAAVVAPLLQHCI